MGRICSDIVLAIVSAIFLPSCVSNDLVAGYYSIGISVLSIVFSIYFAALAIIIASPPDDFVKFMEGG